MWLWSLASCLGSKHLCMTPRAKRTPTCSHCSQRPPISIYPQAAGIGTDTSSSSSTARIVPVASCPARRRSQQINVRVLWNQSIRNICSYCCSAVERPCSQSIPIRPAVERPCSQTSTEFLLPYVTRTMLDRLISVRVGGPRIPLRWHPWHGRVYAKGADVFLVVVGLIPRLFPPVV